MSRIILETGRDHRVEILPHPAGVRLFREFIESAPESVELLHVKYSGEALYFVHRLSVDPLDDELTDTLEPGSFSYFPDLAEFILAYGRAAPRDHRGPIDVACVGTVSDWDGLRGLGRWISRHGREAVRIRAEP
jgi:hypothetical protein